LVSKFLQNKLKSEDLGRVGGHPNNDFLFWVPAAIFEKLKTKDWFRPVSRLRYGLGLKRFLK
jgi:hypothetical protein